MHRQFAVRAAAFSAATFMLAGCSFSKSSIAPVPASRNPIVPASSSRSLVDATTPLLYASQNGANKILVYKQAGTHQVPISTISTSLNGPLGMFVASNHDLYVVNQSVSTILIFKRGAKSPYKTLSDPGYFPVGVFIDKTSGTVFVTNTNTTGGGPGNVAVYAHGSTTPTSTLTMPSNSAVAAAAIDQHHDLWVNYRDLSGISLVAEFVKEKGAAKSTSITTGDGRGMLFDKADDLVIVDRSVPNVAIWPPPYSSVSKTCAATGDPRQISPSAIHPGYFVADVSNAAIEEVTYSNCATVDTITSGLSITTPASHIATDPD